MVDRDKLNGLCFDHRENLYLAGAVGGRLFRHDSNFYFTDFKGTPWDPTGGIYYVSECNHRRFVCLLERSI